VRRIEQQLKDHRIRVITDLRNEKVGFKIREHTLARIPYQLVIGDREVESEQVAVRNLDGEDIGTMSVQDLANLINDAAAKGSSA